jgi:hypothetical protein
MILLSGLMRKLGKAVHSEKCNKWGSGVGSRY